MEAGCFMRTQKDLAASVTLQLVARNVTGVTGLWSASRYAIVRHST